MSDLHIAREPHVGDHGSTPESMYFATRNQAASHLIYTVGDHAKVLVEAYGQPLIDEIVKWRGARLGADCLYIKDAEGKVTGLATLPVKDITAALDLRMQGGFRARVAGNLIDDVASQVAAGAPR